ncbi:Coenzyme F420 hydrogenase/dehydrogenase, beta subunit C-terminal domain [Eubacterium coprostanoligenes]|uniref:Coenzyme F420 hydrogenase/dehydrogenase, beta subunit C-terminal domain n=1 Tax=Eubacterium coprostanoligenes TaxID=290054 RepID=UPI002357D5D0|nr:Coenzyme F420 hydrogenase/dehydrogenase, beta subunit C-terminal domain [Eubacterium coprostanoligenes]MCI6354389.1 Coenzyme F420 hydrogenase/dehydrogenase, beta subunit C-terminal domain [Eubacterium coprostanoligenes]
MIDKVKVQDCVLCKACSNACPVDAISFTNEYLDFNYPLIDFDKCVKCNKCEMVCPTLNEINSSSIKQAFAAKNLDENTRLKSTSGGVFIELAKVVLSNGGYVCGAVFDDDFSVKHIVSNDIEQVKKMSGSKYSQSDIGTVYREIKDLLCGGKIVLFTGSPCQTQGLSMFLGKEYENLISVDFICHGIPSRKLLKTYLDLRKNQYNSEIKNLSFRSKDLGWHNSSVKIDFENGKVYREPITIDFYYSDLFLGNLLLKESCYNCPSRKFKSKSDITLGDFWGAEKVFKEYDDNKGISAVIANTEKGRNILSELAIDTKNVNIETIIEYNQNILVSPKPSSIREEFYKLVDDIGFDNAFENYYKKTSKDRKKKRLMAFMRKIKHLIFDRNRSLY